MEELNKNIEGIRRMMSDLRDEKYAIVNPTLIELDEYEKTLYLKVLCSLVQFGAVPDEMQLLFLKRIVYGMDVEDTVEEYMRRALEISETDMQEFLAAMKENKAKYYFALDGLILTAMEQEVEERYRYLAEIIELLDICEDDLQYVCFVASSVLQQQSSFYDEAKAFENERLREIDYAPYIQSFYSGAIKDSMELVHYVAPDKMNADSIAFRRSYTEKRVIFENLNISISETWYFVNCEEVIFNNCNFVGSSASVEMNGCKNICIQRCRFSDFRVPVFKQRYNIAVLISECEFENCVDTGKGRAYFYGGELGGVIYTYDKWANASNMIRKTKFRNCGGGCREDTKVTGIISNCRCEVSDCSFYHCHQYDKNGISDQSYSTLFSKDTVESNNELINSPNLC